MERSAYNPTFSEWLVLQEQFRDFSRIGPLAEGVSFDAWLDACAAYSNAVEAGVLPANYTFELWLEFREATGGRRQ
jgi:hypothetical protein